MDSDSDDELMSALAGGGFKQSQRCFYCDKASARLECTTCHIAVYCDSDCLRRHFKQHRGECISAINNAESEEEDGDEASEESESEDEEIDRRGSMSSRRGSISRRKSANASNGPPIGLTNVPGLTEKQVKKLMQLSKQSGTNNDEQTKAIKELEAKIQALMQNSESRTSSSVSTDSKKALSSSDRSQSFKTKELKDVKSQLQELQRLVASGGFNNEYGGERKSSIVYKPLLVKDDAVFQKYFKLQAMDMATDQIKMKMELDGLDPSLLDTPGAVSPNDPGPPAGAYVPMKIRDDPKFTKYFKLKNMNMPLEQIRMKMEVDGVDPDLLDKPDDVSPNDPGPPVVYPQQRPSFTSMNMAGSPPPLNFSFGGTAAPEPTYVPLKIKDDPAFAKYFKLLKMGMPEVQVKLKMSAENVDPELLSTPDEVSPNDPGPPSAVSAAGAGLPANITMDQLFAMVMQHQQVIEGSGGVMSGGRRSDTSTGSFEMPARSVEDQMALDLAQAENAVSDLFGDEEVISSGGMTMVQQLEKKARKDANKKIVANKDKINSTVAKFIENQFTSEEDAIASYKLTSDILESCGLLLGADTNETWAARLLIKNKDTRDWYFSKDERSNAGSAYIKLWALSSLSTYVGQLEDKRKQIENAPQNFIKSCKTKSETIDKFTGLLKDSVKLKHKIFKSRHFQAEMNRLAELKIPQNLNQQGENLVDSASILGNASLDLAVEEFNALEKLTRGKKLRAHTAIHVGEKAVQLVNIVKKLKASGLDEHRLREIEGKVSAAKDEYLGDEEEEDEDDCL